MRPSHMAKQQAVQSTAGSSCFNAKPPEYPIALIIPNSIPAPQRKRLDRPNLQIPIAHSIRPAGSFFGDFPTPNGVRNFTKAERRLRSERSPEPAVRCIHPWALPTLGGPSMGGA
ncbi:MAG: hypothetical protein JWN43_191, partial [Gammaproteobacteria bacterium]|nr:hypothetical protein [Gammaproteobacteria bacterium]